MTGNELADRIASIYGLTKADAKKYVEAVFAMIGDAAAKGDEVAINGFGKFTVKKSAARDGRNPRTGERMSIKAASRVSFKAGKALKDKLNG